MLLLLLLVMMNKNKSEYALLQIRSLGEQKYHSAAAEGK